jgi:AraC family transcriptional regulator
MLAEICEFTGKLLAGVRRRTSFANDRTSELWQEFRSREAEIAGRVGRESYSVKVYDPAYSFAQFDPVVEFEKWAAAEVRNPCYGFESLEIPAGKYAVFTHKGTAADAPRTFEYIFGHWLPNSGFDLELRPHFELLPDDYDPFDPNSQEQVWIPIKER